MSTLIELQEPFSSKWRKGYLWTDKKGRRHVQLYNSPSDKRTISYARYLYGVKEGFEVPEDIEIDHHDNDHTNDDIDNLKPMTKAMHRAKTYMLDKDKGQEVRLQCPHCREYFWRLERDVRAKQKAGRANIYCSRKCTLAAVKPPMGLSPDTIALIKRLRRAGKSSYSIADELRISRTTVMKHWQ